jgi:hypothetical protein
MDEDLKFGDSTRVCDSSRVSGATDVGMPFGYPRISIPGLAHYGSRQVQGLEDDLETKKEGSNPYSTRTLINLSLVAYIKPGKGAPRERTQYHRHRISDYTQY